MYAKAFMLLSATAPSMLGVEAFSPQTQHIPIICSRAISAASTHQSPLHARGEGFDLDDEDDAERDFAYARRGRRGREEGGYYDDQPSSSSSSSSNKFQDNVEFFDLDDDDDEFENEVAGDIYDDEKFNGIIPNPLLDAMDPDGVYERLGPELFKDWTFFRDMALFAAFLAFFTRDTHHYGTFDSVIEGLERLPADFI